jgi:hypothetical protein
MPKIEQHYVDAERRLWVHIGVTSTERLVMLPSGGRVRVQEIGAGPPFVLLHGVCLHCWDQVARCWRPDVSRAHGLDRSRHQHPLGTCRDIAPWNRQYERAC